jgi:hypothetical protein
MDPDSARRGVRVATLATLLTGALVAVVASRPGSPFTPPLFPGGEAHGLLQGAASLLGLDRIPRDLVAVIGAAAVFAAAGAFIYSLRQAWRGSLSVRRVVAVALLLHVLALLVPVFLSRDVYSYAIYGRMVSKHGANPYEEVPATFASDPYYARVSVDWIDSRSVYGPAFSALSAGVTSVTSTPANTVFAFKLVAAVASIITMLLAAAAARRVRPERAAFAAALIGWNPVVVFHGVAGGHNDALLGLAVAAGALALLAHRQLWATAALTAGTLIKVSGAVPLLVAVAAAVIARPRGARLRALGAHSAVALAVTVPFVVPFMQLEDPTLGTLELTGRQGWLAPSRFVLVILRGAANFLGGPTAGDVVGLIVRLAFPLVFALVIFALLRHLARDTARIDPVLVVGAMGWASLISLMISPVLLPWYVAWLIPLPWILPRSARGGAVLISVALTITELVAEPSRAPRVWEVMVFGLHWVATPVVLLVLVHLLLELRRRLGLRPGRGFADPLMLEELPLRRPRAGEREPGALTGAAASGRGGHVPQGPQHHRADQASESSGMDAEAIGGERAEDRHGDPG